MATGTRRISVLGPFALVVALASGCTSPAADTANAASAPKEIEPRPTPIPAAAGGAAVPDRPPATSAVPAELLRSTRADLDARLAAAKLQAAAVRVLVAEPVTWNDGSLGCPKPGMMYTMALVPGYRVVYGVKVGGEERQYAYHAGRNGYFQYCEHPAPPSGANPAA